MGKFRSNRDRISFLFVNDGSTDGTLEFLAAHCSDGMHIMNLKQNSGKAEAVRQGMLHIRNMPIYDGFEWIGFIDADIATPIAEVFDFILYNEMSGFHADAIWRCRMKRLGSTIRRSPLRHLCGRTFATIVGLYLKTGFYDSQCGAKLFKKEYIHDLFQAPFLSQWIFNIEIYMRMRGRRIIEYPVREWKDIHGGKMNVRKMLLPTLS